MPDQFYVANFDDLHNRFGQFDEIASITQQLRTELDTIKTDNDSAADPNSADPISAQYRNAVDEPTQRLSDLVDAISKVFSVTSDNGKTTTKGIVAAEDHNTNIAQGL